MNDFITSPEIWKPIPGYEEFYEVSNMGRVRSYHSNDHYTENRKVKVPRILRQYKMDKGYTKVVLCIPGQLKKGKLVHWLVAEAFIGPRPEGLDLNHINGVKDDNRPENLEYVTRQENILHKINVLGKSRGSNMHSALLNEEQVIEIRRLWAEQNVKLTELGKRFGVTADAIGKIVHRKNWRHI